jgi:peptide/nickel transport system permease protein
MVASGRDAMLDAWWITTFPGLAIVFTVMAFNLVGDGLRDALDPRRVA